MKKLLGTILRIQTESYQTDDMQEFLLEWGRNAGVDVLQGETGNLYMIKGKAESYPCIVAHMDTVHSIHKGGITLLTVDGKITGFNKLEMEQTGVGGDDKCGIYAALVCLKQLPACKAVFFVDEEVGCVGSGNCDLTFFKDCRFILQADRRGCSDWVKDISGPLGSDDFPKAVGGILKKYKFKPCKGMMTDVMALRDSKVGVSCANMSAGYYNPHQQNEFVSIRALNNCVSMMLEICHRLVDSFPFVYEAPPRMFSGFKRLGRNTEDYSDWWWGKKDRPADLIGPDKTGFYPANWYDEEFNLHTSSGALDEYCLSCWEVLPLSEMVEMDGNTFICNACYEDVHGRQK